MTAWHYSIFGLRVRSALHIPEWDAFAADDFAREPDVDIVRSGPDAEPAGPQVYRFTIDGVGHFQISHGARIAVEPAPDADDKHVRVFLLGSSLAAVCMQRRLTMLHASVVRVGDRAVALCGPTGAGKSTLAAALVARGAAFICDDLTRCDLIDGRAMVYPSAPRMKLQPAALHALALPTDGLEKVHTRAVKFHVEQARPVALEPVALHEIYLLEWADTLPSLARVTGLAAVQALVAGGTYRPSLVTTLGLTEAHWQHFLAIAAATSLVRVSRRRQWQDLDDVADQIIRRRVDDGRGPS